jgi:hypothetical protein
VEVMTEKKDRDRVMAEITLSHLLRLADEQGCHVTRQEALAFFNQEGRAFDMWRHMMQAGEEFIASSLLHRELAEGHKVHASTMNSAG